MRFFSASALRTDTKEIWQALDRSEDVVLTTNGRPRALVIEIPGGDLEMSLRMVSSARAMLSLQSIRTAAIANGTADMGMEEINAEIAAARAERHATESAN